MPDEKVIELAGVTKSFAGGFFGKIPVLKGISFTVTRGEAVGIAGPSGAGKTTLLKILLGLVKPCEGGVKLFGEKPLAALTHHVVGYVPDDHGLPPGVKVRESVALHDGLLGLHAAGMNPAMSGRLEEALGIRDVGDARAETVSMGTRARIAFALALKGEPSLLVLDDPFIGVDPEMRGFMRHELRGYLVRRCTLVVTSHMLLELSDVVSRVLLINGGMLAADDSAHRVYPDVEQWYRDGTMAFRRKCATEAGT